MEAIVLELEGMALIVAWDFTHSVNGRLLVIGLTSKQTLEALCVEQFPFYNLLRIWV